jgi:hypothetical protein
MPEYMWERCFWGRRIFANSNRLNLLFNVSVFPQMRHDAVVFKTESAKEKGAHPMITV